MRRRILSVDLMRETGHVARVVKGKKWSGGRRMRIEGKVAGSGRR